MTVEEFRAVLAAHGGALGTEVLDKATDETIDTPSGPVKTGEKVPPAQIRLRFTTKDGEITVRPRDDGTYDILDDPKGLVKAADSDGGNKPIEVGGTLVQKQPDGTYKPVYTPPAKKPETVTETGPGGAQRQVTTAQADQDYREAQELSRQKQLTAQELTAAATAKHQQLQSMVALGQLEQKDADARMDRWKAGVEAGQTERRLAIEQQNANTSAGNLGVNRGQLGVSQQNADTQRESVIQSAASNAVDQTIRLLSQYTKVGPGFGAQFAAGVNMLSGGGGKMNVTPDAFMVTPPDLNAIRTQAVTEAIDRLKGGGAMAPATAAAVNATAVPTAPAPAAVPPPPAQAPGQFTPAAIGQAGAAMGVLPGAPPAPPPVLPPYTGPVGQGGPGAPRAY